MRITRSIAVAVAAACIIASTACTSRWTGSDYFERHAQVTEPDTQVTGETLIQQKQKMRRLHRDLKSLHATAESLRRHMNVEGIASLEAFLYPYLRHHAEPLVTAQSPTWHPELELLQANLMFAKAAVLIELRDRYGLRRVTNQIEIRFGRKSMLVEYPLGSESTLAKGLKDLVRKGEIL